MKLSSLLSRRIRFAAVIAVAALCLLLVSTLIPKPIHFESLREFIAFARAKELFLPPEIGVANNIFVAERPITAERMRELAALDARTSGHNPTWRGLVWVWQIESKWSRIDVGSFGGKTRIWGNLLVAGDEELMDRIERLRRGP
jgi:hypothetical protein